MLAAQTYLLAATAHGLATAPMEGFDAARLRAYLDVPARYALPLVVAARYMRLGELLYCKLRGIASRLLAQHCV